ATPSAPNRNLGASEQPSSASRVHGWRICRFGVTARGASMTTQPEMSARSVGSAEVAPQVDNLVRLAGAEQTFLGREVFYRDLLNALPAAIYTTDAAGRITFYNEAAVEFAGRRPALGDEWCVTWKLYNLDGS